uniref:Uncharacterized protein n=1 Tax=Meloidogyne incognita TaxID=6306 RepID=A0A914MA98_MELIC
MTGGSQPNVLSQITVYVPPDLGYPFKIMHMQLDTDESLPLAMLECYLPGARGLFYTAVKDNKTTTVLIDRTNKKLIFPPITEVLGGTYEVYLGKIDTCCKQAMRFLCNFLTIAKGAVIVVLLAVIAQGIYSRGSETKDFLLFTLDLFACAGHAGICLAFVGIIFFGYDNIRAILAKVEDIKLIQTEVGLIQTEIPDYPDHLG